MLVRVTCYTKMLKKNKNIKISSVSLRMFSLYYTFGIIKKKHPHFCECFQMFQLSLDQL